MLKKVIKTRPFHPEAQFFPAPELAKKNVPFWFKKLPQTMAPKDPTIKMCVPFLDAITAGYLIVLPCDVLVTINDNEIKIEPSDTRLLLLETHAVEQIAPEMVSSEFWPNPIKLINYFVVNTPKNYSLLYTHPLNRTDLPFYTLSGIVDSDKYPQNVNLPFFLKKSFSGLLPKGTPIAQLLPIKRDDWELKNDPFDAQLTQKVTTEFKSYWFRAYKKLWWQNKKFN